MDKKLKLLYFVEAFGGGVFTYLVDMANKLSEKYSITIAYGLRDQTPQNFRDYFVPEIEFIKVENFGRSIDPLKEIRAFFEIKKISDTVKPDIIHLHSSKAGLLGRFALNGRKIPLFYTPHGYSFLMMDQSKLKRNIYKFIEKAATVRRCTTISCSKGEHEETLKLTKDAVYVSNGINAGKLSQEFSDLTSADTDSAEHVVFTIGRVCYQKNPALFNSIARKFPAVKFIWIGDGDLNDTLTSENIEKTGWLDRESVLQKAKDADIFILTSLWEGLPISLLEAMFMKKTCIVSNVVGNRDVIRNDYNGFLCGDETEFVKAVETALNNDTSVLKENAYKDVIEVYNTEVMTGEYDRIYSDAVKSMQRS